MSSSRRTLSTLLFYTVTILHSTAFQLRAKLTSPPPVHMLIDNHIKRQPE